MSMKQNHVVVDVEIQNTIEETPGGWDATDQLGVAVAVVYDYEIDRYRVYGPDEVGELRDRLLRADRITGYNIFNFDFPVIWGIPKQQWLADKLSFPIEDGDTKIGSIRRTLHARTNDILRNIWKSLALDPDNFNPSTHGGMKLDDVAMATLGKQKIANGAIAPVWYKQGLIQKVANYCIDDVALEKELGEFIDRYGYVLDKRGKQIFINPQP